MDTVGGQPVTVTEAAAIDEIYACWSPDSQRIAYSAILGDARGKRAGETRLNVVDADGKNPATLIAEKHPSLSIQLLLLDWR